MCSDDILPFLIIVLVLLIYFCGNIALKANGKNIQDGSSTYQEATIVNPVVDHMLSDGVSGGETETVCNMEN